MKKCSTSQIETLARDFRYNGKLWKPRRKNKDPKYNEALSDHLYRGILAAITEEAEYPLLSEQVELLNARVLLKELITNSRADRQDDINHILEEVRKDMDAPAIKYIDTRRAELLKDIPARIAALKVAVNDTTSKINHLKQLIVTYKNWQKKWEGKLNILKKWRKWWEFSKEVLAIDRQINPHKNIKSMLENLDEIRRQISTPPKYSTGQINQHKLNAAAATLEKMAKDLRGE
ncbi:MAG: hypothetical protein GY757_03225 [bacterium]|nr:hypothetical protein [bacterium]